VVGEVVGEVDGWYIDAHILLFFNCDLDSSCKCSIFICPLESNIQAHCTMVRVGLDHIPKKCVTRRC
jgi:hypothetical protein